MIADHHEPLLRTFRMQKNAEPVALVPRGHGEGAALPLQVFLFRVFHGVKHDVRGAAAAMGTMRGTQEPPTGCETRMSATTGGGRTRQHSRACSNVKKRKEERKGTAIADKDSLNRPKRGAGAFSRSGFGWA